MTSAAIVGVQMGKCIQAGLTKGLIYQRHVGGFFAFHVGDVWLKSSKSSNYLPVLLKCYRYL
jgi:hypothetical protein